MKTKSLLKLILRYLKDHLKAILLEATFIVVFLVVFLLYQINLEAVLYAALLCGIVFIPAVCLDFLRYYKTHKALLGVKDSGLLELGDLPNSKTLIENDYKELLEALLDDKNKLVSLNDKQLVDMVDYYTLWVHQIKTPIAAMSLLLQLEEHPQRSQLEVELFKTEQYVEMVLAYLRLSASSTDYVIKSYDLDDIIKQVIRKFTPLFIKGNIKLNYTPVQQSVVTDEKWFLYSVEQLVSNAIKYTPSGEISIYTQNSTLIIEDTGMGILPSDLPRIFERGFTGYNGRIHKKASGLGLYLCKRILTNLSHTIEIQSSPKQGTKALVGLGRSDLVVE